MTPLITAIGDLSLYRTVPLTIERVGLENFCREARADLAPGALRFANFEVPLSARPREDDFSLVGPISMAPVVGGLGLNVVNVANNHIMDAGLENFRATLEAIHNVGVKTVGAGMTLADARRPVVLETDSGRIGVLGYAEGNPKLHRHLASIDQPGAAPADADLMREDIVALRPHVDIVVVSLHWGVNYMTYAMPQQRALAAEVLGAGADVIIGTHPHVLQGVERFGRGMVVYSLGDFICDPTVGNVVLPERIRARRETAVIQIDPAGEHRWIPYRAGEDCWPQRLHSTAAEEALARIGKLDSIYTDGSYPKDPWAGAGEEIGGHALKVLLFHLKRGNFGYLATRMLRIRSRHLRMLRGLLFRGRE